MDVRVRGSTWIEASKRCPSSRALLCRWATRALRADVGGRRSSSLCRRLAKPDWSWLFRLDTSQSIASGDFWISSRRGNSGSCRSPPTANASREIRVSAAWAVGRVQSLLWSHARRAHARTDKRRRDRLASSPTARDSRQRAHPCRQRNRLDDCPGSVAARRSRSDISLASPATSSSVDRVAHRMGGSRRTRPTPSSIPLFWRESGRSTRRPPAQVRPLVQAASTVREEVGTLGGGRKTHASWCWLLEVCGSINSSRN